MRKWLHSLMAEMMPSKTNHRIIQLFISAPEENELLVSDLRRALRRRRINVLFMSHICKAGENVAQRIECGIRSADVFSILLTDDPPIGCYEEFALARGCRKPSVPLKEKGTKIDETVFVSGNMEFIEMDSSNLRLSAPIIADRIIQVYLEGTLPSRLKRRRWEVILLGLSSITTISHYMLSPIFSYPLVLVDILAGLLLVFRQ